MGTWGQPTCICVARTRAHRGIAGASSCCGASMRSPAVVSSDGAGAHGRVGSQAYASRSHATHGGTAN
eukprot:4486008-Alexandrium_andersonii.AAC.1